MALRAEASVWANELRTGALPNVCVKSGHLADSHLMFGFGVLSYAASLLVSFAISGVIPGAAIGGSGVVRGTLPLTYRWRQTFVRLRIASVVAAGLGIVLLVTIALWRPQIRGSWAIGFGSLAAALVLGIVYIRLAPKGQVFKAPGNDMWVRLRDVHPNFASAVAAMDEPTPPPS